MRLARLGPRARQARHRRGVAALLASLALLPQLGTEFLPELNEGSVWVSVDLPTSVSVPAAQRMTREIRRALEKFPEVASVISKAGRPEDAPIPSRST